MTPGTVHSGDDSMVGYAYTQYVTPQLYDDDLGRDYFEKEVELKARLSARVELGDYDAEIELLGITYGWGRLTHEPHVGACITTDYACTAMLPATGDPLPNGRPSDATIGQMRVELGVRNG